MAADTGTDTAPDATEDATNTVDSGTASPEASAPGMDTDSANVASGTDQGDSDRVEPAGSDTAATTPAMTPSGQTETTPATTDTDATPGTAATADAPAGGQTQAMDSAEISHAIIDVGGFLGMGEHRVAVPVGDLVVYQKDDDIRIYLPWTREQLEALPEFDEDAAATTMQ
ncbi:hypothetical protein [Paracoccus thiocyanatus]|uniref:PRC-barrel domain-containing protein n=1 Tax=Paracoccus thiocyanatus TaxID=34006 RepID=A0A3D8PBY5_9RHOB|nr:hypothetical protein [Paracoccus thiocyanatus]RDW12828.1 hypothetical protein DIE28_11515 [Paracoccus thiocyanatus]